MYRPANASVDTVSSNASMWVITHHQQKHLACHVSLISQMHIQVTSQRKTM